MERDEETGKPIWKVKDIQSELSNIPKLLEELRAVEDLVKQEMIESNNNRGGVVQGYIPDFAK